MARREPRRTDLRARLVLAVSPDPTAAAFFDVDNTIMQGASIFHLARGLHRRRFFTTRDIVSAAWQPGWLAVRDQPSPGRRGRGRGVAGAVAGGAVAGVALHRRLR